MFEIVFTVVGGIIAIIAMVIPVLHFYNITTKDKMDR